MQHRNRIMGLRRKGSRRIASRNVQGTGLCKQGNKCTSNNCRRVVQKELVSSLATIDSLTASTRGICTYIGGRPAKHTDARATNRSPWTPHPDQQEGQANMKRHFISVFVTYTDLSMGLLITNKLGAHQSRANFFKRVLFLTSLPFSL